MEQDPGVGEGAGGRGSQGVSGEVLDKWKAAAPDLIIPGFWTEIAGTKPEEIRSLRKDFLEGCYEVLGEVLNQYDGLSSNDPLI